MKIFLQKSGDNRMLFYHRHYYYYYHYNLPSLSSFYENVSFKRHFVFLQHLEQYLALSSTH